MGDRLFGSHELIKSQLVVTPGDKANVVGRDHEWLPGHELKHLKSEELDVVAKATLVDRVEKLSEAQELLWASGTRALLIVFQAMDAAGKDSTIKNVMSGVNPQGVQVVSFKQPSIEELAHDFLWRVSRSLPQRGRIGIFNRSHYEEVIAVRVHPEWLDRQNLPERGPNFWTERYESINDFERHLCRTGTAIVKFFLNVSKDEQVKRFLARLDNPAKLWKFSAGDVDEREIWDQYMVAYEEAITATSTPWAPWYVIPADDKQVMQALVAGVLVETIEGMKLSWPTVSAEDMKANEAARARLEAELKHS